MRAKRETSRRGRITRIFLHAVFPFCAATLKKCWQSSPRLKSQAACNSWPQFVTGWQFTVQLWRCVLMLSVCRSPSGVTTTCHRCQGAQWGEKRLHCHSQWAERLALVVFGHQAGSACYQERERGGGGGDGRVWGDANWERKERRGRERKEGRWFINNQRCVTATASLRLPLLLLGFEMPPNTHTYTTEKERNLQSKWRGFEAAVKKSEGGGVKGKSSQQPRYLLRQSTNEWANMNRLPMPRMYRVCISFLQYNLASLAANTNSALLYYTYHK